MLCAGCRVGSVGPCRTARFAGLGAFAGRRKSPPPRTCPGWCMGWRRPEAPPGLLSSHGTCPGPQHPCHGGGVTNVLPWVGSTLCSLGFFSFPGFAAGRSASLLAMAGRGQPAAGRATELLWWGGGGGQRQGNGDRGTGQGDPPRQTCFLLGPGSQSQTPAPGPHFAGRASTGSSDAGSFELAEKEAGGRPPAPGRVGGKNVRWGEGPGPEREYWLAGRAGSPQLPTTLMRNRKCWFGDNYPAAGWMRKTPSCGVRPRKPFILCISRCC